MNPAKPPRLGQRQKQCLASLVQHGCWPRDWLWGSFSDTARILDSLVRHGLVRHDVSRANQPGVYSRYGYYYPTPAGRALVGRDTDHSHAD